MRQLGVTFVWLASLCLLAGCEIKTSRVEPTKSSDKLSGEIRIDGSSTVAPITAIIAEDETTTIVTTGFTARIEPSGAIRLTAKAALQEAAQ